MSVTRGKVLAIASRPEKGADMKEHESCEVVAGSGIVHENRNKGTRELTILSREAWEAACAELGTDLPWHTRRANIYVEGIDLQAARDKEISIGSVRVRVHGETRPCALMDKLQDGLRNALAPNWRGGVITEVLQGGTISIGDELEVLS